VATDFREKMAKNGQKWPILGVKTAILGYF
jgi:hypothetical protein